MLYIGEIAQRLGVSRSWAHRLAERYHWPFEKDKAGFKQYPWPEVEKLTPDQATRRARANDVRRVRGLQRYRGR